MFSARSAAAAGIGRPRSAGRDDAELRLAATRDSTVRRLLGVSDAIAVLLALVAALAIPARGPVGDRLLWGVAVLPTMIVLFKLYGLYDRDATRMSHSTVDAIPC